jgi:Tol biopolymer transport system component
MKDEENSPQLEEARLDSWKDIAAYLKRDVRTVKRWEKLEGLPVHRHLHQARSSVYAYPSEINAWSASRKPRREEVARWRRVAPSLAFAAVLMLSLMLVADAPFSASAVAAAQQASGQNGTVTRQVWTMPAQTGISYGAVSPDGRYLPFTDFRANGNGDIFLRDLTTGTDRRVTSGGKFATVDTPVPESEVQYGEEWSFSPDGKQLVFSWYIGWKQRQELRVIDLQGEGVPQFRLLFDNPEVEGMNPQDWSPDGKWIAVYSSGQIGLLSVQDGSLRVLKSTQGLGPERMYFSPDGKYLAYDLPAGDTGVQSDIFVLATDASAEIAAVVHASRNLLVGWSRDGARLLFRSDRGGSEDLWALRFADGKTQGSPELIKRDVRGFPIGITASGSLYTQSRLGGQSNIQMASFDFAKGQFLSAPAPGVSTFVGTNGAPAWSRDGKYLAYLSRRSLEIIVIGIRTRTTGQVRELPSEMVRLDSFRWAPDGASFIAVGRDNKHGNGIYRIDAQSGRASLMVSRKAPTVNSPALSPDGKTLYYNHMIDLPGAEDFAFVKRDMASGNETELLRRPLLGPKRTPVISLSPDGRYLAATIVDGSTKSNTFWIVPTAGGEPREVIRRAQPQGLGLFVWGPDSRSLLLRVRSGGDKAELWRAFVDGAPAVRLDATLDTNIASASLHPDGRQIAFETRTPATPTEIWVTENFLPALKAAK